MTVALIHRGIGSQAIEVAFAFDVIDPYALGALEDDIEGMIVMSAVLVLEFDEVVGA
jgi:hypothetical protein